MEKIYVKVKGIIRRGDKLLVIKRWVDDRIPDPFVWEFIDTEVSYGEAPNDAVRRAILEHLSVNGKIERIAYTWSSMVGERQCIGISYLCTIDENEEDNIVLAEEDGEWEWVEKDNLNQYIHNQYVLEDLEGVEL